MELREALAAAMEEPKNEAPTTETRIDAAENETVQKSAHADSEAGENATHGEGNLSGSDAEDNEDASGKDKAANPEKVVEKPDAGAPSAVHRVDRAPASWRKEAKGEWANVPLHIRQEVHKREMEITRALNEANQARQSAQQFEQAAQPYMARIQSLGVTPQQAFNELLKADYTLATGTPQTKAQLMDKLIQDYGIDIVELDAAIARRLGVGGQPGQQPQQQMPDIQALVQQQLQQALAPIYQQQQQAQVQQQQQAAQTVEQMALDPKYPHFEEVRQDMADLIELSSRRGVALSLDQAYSRAVSGNPELSAMNLAAQQNQRAQRAAQAAASVSGSPVGGGTQQHASVGDLRADLEAAFGGSRI